jgi:hypothetical protein
MYREIFDLFPGFLNRTITWSAGFPKILIASSKVLYGNLIDRNLSQKSHIKSSGLNGIRRKRIPVAS